MTLGKTVSYTRKWEKSRPREHWANGHANWRDDAAEHCPTSIGELVKAGLGMWECPPGAVFF